MEEELPVFSLESVVVTYYFTVNTKTNKLCWDIENPKDLNYFAKRKYIKENRIPTLEDFKGAYERMDKKSLESIPIRMAIISLEILREQEQW